MIFEKIEFDNAIFNEIKFMNSLYYINYDEEIIQYNSKLDINDENKNE